MCFVLYPSLAPSRTPALGGKGLSLLGPWDPAGDGATGCSSLHVVCPVVVFIAITLLLVQNEARSIAVVGINVFPAMVIVLLDDFLVGVFGWFVHTANIQKSPEGVSRLLKNLDRTIIPRSKSLI